MNKSKEIYKQIKETLRESDYITATLKLMNYLGTLTPKEREEVRIDYGI